MDAGLERIAEDSWLSRTVQDWGEKLGFRGMGRTPYDMFMLGFHDYLKENSAFQQDCPKMRLEFPPFRRGLCLPMAWRTRPCPDNTRSNRRF